MPVPTVFWLTPLLVKPVIVVVPPPEPSIRMPLALDTTALLLKSIVSVGAAEVRASKPLPVAAMSLLLSVAVKAPVLPALRSMPSRPAPLTRCR